MSVTNIFISTGENTPPKAPTGPDWGGTTNNITAYALDHNDARWPIVTYASTIKAQSGFMFMSSLKSSEIQSLLIETYGTDALWINWIKLSGEGNPIKWGKENSEGWVLSTDPVDGSTEKGGRAYSGFKFDKNNDVFGYESTKQLGISGDPELTKIEI